MNHRFKKLIALMSALIVLTLGIAAFAEPSDTLEDETTATIETEVTDDDDALYQEALTQYQQARAQNTLTDLETELADMVSAGQLTQAQADLLLERAQAQYSLSNGLCPNCAAQLPTTGRGMNKGMGGRASRNWR